LHQPVGRALLKAPGLSEGKTDMSSTTLIILIVLAFVVFGGGGGYYWSRRGR
jgi:hypothetical protein